MPIMICMLRCTFPPARWISYVSASVMTLPLAQLSNDAQLICLWQGLHALLKSGRSFTSVMSEACGIKSRHLKA